MKPRSGDKLSHLCILYDGIKKYDISEIGHERRNGYSWYNKDGSKVLKRYEKWKKEQNK